jgi:3',5'-cyclic-AMP phosphodiesterase
MNTPLSRRRLLVGAGASLAVGAAARPALAGAADSFSFVHLTDTHIQPELGAKEGVAKAFAAVRALKEKPAFALVGGDIVMDTAYADRKRSELQYALWREAAASLKMPVYYSVGNHDVYAIGGDNRVATDDPEYGKKWWLKRLGLANRYGSFEYGGWKFITLDSVQSDAEGKWWGELDAEQVTWLDDTLRKTDRKQPLVFLTHIPLMTVFGQYTQGTTAALGEGMIVKNGKQFVEMTTGYNVQAVFQGHTHVVEECVYRGARFITGGAVCGDWWKGKRLGIHPEGFTVATVKGGQLTHRYVAYGWEPRSV